jgi:uncharacterized protein YcbX
MNNISITGIFVYPVKSMRGIPLKQAVLTGKGLLHDRQWMVVQSNGRFATQRDHPRLSLIHTSMDATGLQLSMDGMETVRIPLEAAEGRIIETSVWGAECRTIDQGEEVSRWLSEALQLESPVHLVRMQADYQRPQQKAELLGADNRVDFADAAPFLVTNEASLTQLNFVLMSKWRKPVTMDRFRPNIVIKGIEAFSEHRLARLYTAAYSLDVCYPCERCIVTTINQETAQRDPWGEPFKTLQKINPMPGKPHAPAFGENAILSHGEGETISVGDSLTPQPRGGN